MTEIQRCLDWFKTAKQNPSHKDVATQAGAVFEEMAELTRSFGIRVPRLEEYRDKFYREQSILDVAERPINTTELLDAMCDVMVTIIGLAYMLGLDIQGAFSEVLRSNESKFEQGKPLFNEHGKIMKGADYTAPNLEPFLNIKDSIHL